LVYLGASDVEIAVGETREIPLQVVYRGAEPVDIEQVQTGCGCREAVIRPASLRPGESATIRLKVAGESRGADKTDVEIVCNAQNGRKIPLSRGITIRRVHRLVLSSQYLSFGEVPSLMTASQVIKIRETRESDLKSLEATVDTSDFAATVTGPGATADGFSEHSVEVVLRPQAAGRQIKDRVRLACTLSDGKSLTFDVPIDARITNSVRVSPSTGYLGIVRAGQKKSIRFDLATSGEPGKVVVDAVESAPWLNVSHKAYDSDAAVVLDVMFAPKEVDLEARQVSVKITGRVNQQPFVTQVPCVIIPL
jgi:hypothetical protein